MMTVEEGCLLWGIRVVAPQRVRNKLLNELHRDHPGISRMKSVARSYICWPKMDEDIEKMVGACEICQSVKNTPPVVPLQLWIDLLDPGVGFIWISLVLFRIQCFFLQ